MVAGSGIVEFDPVRPDTVIRTLPAPAADVEGLAFDGYRLYASTASGMVYTLDPNNGNVLGSIDLPGGGIFGLGALSRADGAPGRLFAAGSLNSPYYGDKIVEFDPKTGAAIRVLPTSVFVTDPNGLAFDGETLYYVDNSFRQLKEIDPDTGTVLHSTDLVFSDVLSLVRWACRTQWEDLSP